MRASSGELFPLSSGRNHRCRRLPGSRNGNVAWVQNWIDRADVRRLVAANAQLVEVLPRDEWESEHVAGARSIPLKELDERARSELDAGRTVIVYCYGFL